MTPTACVRRQAEEAERQYDDADEGEPEQDPLAPEEVLQCPAVIEAAMARRLPAIRMNEVVSLDVLLTTLRKVGR